MKTPICLRVIFAVFLLATLSCRKTESFSIKREKFEIPMDVNPTVARVIDYINKNERAVSTIAGIGEPLWSKSQVKVSSNVLSARSYISGTDTFVTIPLVNQNYSYVHAFLAIRANETITVRLYRGETYREYPYSTNMNTLSADRIVAQLMILNKQVYNYGKFRIDDPFLFRSTVSPSAIESFVIVDVQNSVEEGNPFGDGGCYAVDMFWDPDGDADPCDCSGNEVFSHIIWEGDDCGGGSGGGEIWTTGGEDPTNGGGGGAGDGGGSSSGVQAPANGIGFTPFPLSDEQVAEIKLSDDFRNDPKAWCVYQKLMQIGNNYKAKGFTMMNNLIITFGGSYNITYGLTTVLPPGELGAEYPLGNFNYRVLLNATELPNLTPLYTAAVLLHETIHAQIDRYIEVFGGHQEDFYFSVAKYYQVTVNSSGTNWASNQHQYMGTQYINPMANVLSEFDNHSKPMQYYIDLAYMTLYDTPFWHNLSSADQTRIYATVSQEFTRPKNC